MNRNKIANNRCSLKFEFFLENNLTENEKLKEVTNHAQLFQSLQLNKFRICVSAHLINEDGKGDPHNEEASIDISNPVTFGLKQDYLAFYRTFDILNFQLNLCLLDAILI